MEKQENKSQLAKEIAHALFVCHLRDNLSELVDDSTITDGRVKKAITDSYLAATVLLVCAIQDSKRIQEACGQG